MDNDASGLTNAELVLLRERLVEARQAILDRTPPRVVLDEQPEVGDDMDVADRGSEKEESGARGNRDAARLAEIDNALAKMERGDYGVSEDSGEPIGFSRLQALPWARLTVIEEEQRAVGRRRS
jgi:DnaK suppressor protein